MQCMCLLIVTQTAQADVDSWQAAQQAVSAVQVLFKGKQHRKLWRQNSVLLATPSGRKPAMLPASRHSDAQTALARLDGSTHQDEVPPPDVFGNLQGELLGHVLQQISWSSREAIALSSVCR